MNEESFDKPLVIEAYNKLVYQVDSYLEAPLPLVWRKLTSIEELLGWDSMLMEFQGEITQGGKIKLRSKISPKQTFKLKVKEFSPNSKMVWNSGVAPIFKGVRTYTVRPYKEGTYFKMEEVFSGLMLPFMKHLLPDCEILFGTYLKDLKNELHNSQVSIS